jgi:two-component system chemotaxis sensor kinase CheA
MPLDFDMELLRLVGDLRTHLSEMEPTTDPSGALARSGPAVARARGALSPVGGALAALEDALRCAAEGGADVRAEAAALLEAVEGVIVEGASSTWPSSMDERLAELVAAAGTDVGVPEVAPDAEGTDVTLHGVANRLIQMEPTISGSIVALRDHFARAIGSWQGSTEVRDQLNEALGVLDTVAVDRAAERDRIEAVERVGQVLEAAILEEEEAALVSAVPLAPVPSAAVDSVDAVPPEGDEECEYMEPAAEREPADTPDEVAPAAEAAAEAVAEPAAEVAVQVAAQVAPEPATPDGDMIVVSEESDPELAIEFVAEGLDYLDQAEKALLALEADPTDAEAVNVTFRAFHTIKGVSAFLALDQVTTIAHHAETLLAQVRSGTLAFTGTAADLFLRSADVLRALLVGIREVARGGSAAVPPAFAPLMAQLLDPGIAEKVAANVALGETGGAATAASAAPAPAKQAAKPAPGATRAARKAQAAGADQPMISAQAEDSVRIRTERLDRLVDLVGELVVAQSMIAQDPEVVGSRGTLKRKVDHSQKILRDLQNLSTSLRMVPLKPAFHKISRVVRDVSQRSGKTVELVTMGDDTELDRSMVGIITDPLVHMVRNAVDHGIEGAEDRAAAGKPAHGTLRMSARQTGGNVVVEIEDDGRGLDRDKILAKAVERGLVDADKSLEDSEVFNLIFAPGFSTAQKVTDISGRGVGMDVVKRAVESLRGRIEIRSELGKGTRFSIYLPLTLAITDGMLVEVGSHRYIIPTQKIHLSFRPTTDDLWSVGQKGEMVMLHEQLIPVARLHRLYGIDTAQTEITQGLLVVVGEGSRKTALLVDQLLGQQQFVVKALTGQVAGTPGVAGGAILGDGAVGLILDPDELVALARTGKAAGQKSWNAA